MEVGAAALPWVVYQLPLTETTVAGYAAPIRGGVATAGIAVFAGFVGGARLAADRSASLGWVTRLSGIVVGLGGGATVLIGLIEANRSVGDDPGLTALALVRAARPVDYGPGPGLAIALAGGLLLTLLGCGLLLADNPSARR